MDAVLNAQINKMLSDLALIRSKKPLVHNLTNYVAMNATANALMSIGTTPIMSQAVEEVEQMVVLSSSLVLNIGTISVQWMESMIKAGQAAILKKIPIVFNPFGAGFTEFRTIECNKIIDSCSPNIIRGKVSEITALINDDDNVQGTDNNIGPDQIIALAKALAQKTKSVVVATGTPVYVTDGTAVNTISFGTDMMDKVAGEGCVSSALIGAFTAVNSSMMDSATNGMLLMCIAGQLAAQTAKGNGSLYVNFIDELYNFDDKVLNRIQ